MDFIKFESDDSVNTKRETDNGQVFHEILFVFQDVATRKVH